MFFAGPVFPLVDQLVRLGESAIEGVAVVQAIDEERAAEIGNVGSAAAAERRAIGA